MPQPAVYADLYVFVNTSMDLLCLNLTAAILHRRTRRWRVLLAALLGGLFSLAVLLAGVDGLPGVLLDLSAAFGICAVAYPVRHERPRVFFATVAAFFLISLLLGGMMTVLFGWLNRLPLPSGALSEDHISVWLFAVLALVSGFLTRRGGRFLGFSSRAKAATAEAVLFGKPVVLRAMVDTANLLRDPSGDPLRRFPPAAGPARATLSAGGRPGPPAMGERPRQRPPRAPGAGLDRVGILAADRRGAGRSRDRGRFRPPSRHAPAGPGRPRRPRRRI